MDQIALDPAPLFDDIIRDHPGGTAYWLHASDGVRIRIGVWPVAEGVVAKGTVLLFPGRTEYVEKYAHTAADLGRMGFATLAVDWRGQGIADRLMSDPLVGHVTHFSDFQLDVQAAVAAARNLDLPAPWFLLGHSMGGCIGLRALYNDLPVKAAVFTGPMWGIQMAAALRPTAWALSWASRKLGLSERLAPQTGTTPYVSSAAFEDNTLTRDAAMWDMMQSHLQAQPELSLGGPSLNWLHEALVEMRTLSKLPAPDLPALTFLGTNERIVDPQRIHQRMASWPKGRLELIEDGEHEVLMEAEQVRSKVLRQIDAFYSEAAAPARHAC